MSNQVLAPYACDRCQSRKVSCSREKSGCIRCGSLDCTYSRTGIIRRKRKRKYDDANEAPSAGPSIVTKSNDTPELSTESTPAVTAVNSHLSVDIESTREMLGGQGLDAAQRSLGALSSLSDACAAVWHDQSDIETSRKSFFVFEEQTASWLDIFTTTLERGRPLLSTAPPDVVMHIRNGRPYLVREKAWLVMYYGVILSNITSNDPTNETVKGKLKCNLWLALNDVRLLMEPSEANIQALTLLACHVEEMLQSLGVNHRRLDPQTRERRILIFFHLNILDKGLSITFGRPPTFHRAMCREIPPPTLEQVRPLQPHVTSAGTSSLFGVHFFRQLMFLTSILGDIWYCLYEDAQPSDSSIQSEIGKLEEWHLQAKTILDAAAMTEGPFLTGESSTSIDLGLCMIDFQYYYILILLCRASPTFRQQAISSSKQMLLLLELMVSDSEESFNGIVWQLVCTPFTAFLTLFADIVSQSHSQQSSQGHVEALDAMEQLPRYLAKMSLRSSLAGKLERVAAVLLEHARSITGSLTISRSANAHAPELTVQDDWSYWDAVFNDVIVDQQAGDNSTLDTTEFPSWTLDTFGGPSLDWMGWDALN